MGPIHASLRVTKETNNLNSTYRANSEIAKNSSVEIATSLALQSPGNCTSVQFLALRGPKKYGIMLYDGGGTKEGPKDSGLLVFVNLKRIRGERDHFEHGLNTNKSNSSRVQLIAEEFMPEAL